MELHERAARYAKASRASVAEVLRRFGSMTFKETFERAARLAEEGWGLAERRHNDLRNSVKGLAADPDSKAAFLDGDQAFPLYSVINNAPHPHAALLFTDFLIGPDGQN